MNSLTTRDYRHWPRPSSSRSLFWCRFFCSTCSSPWWETLTSRSFAGRRKSGSDRCVHYRHVARKNVLKVLL